MMSQSRQHTGPVKNRSVESRPRPGILTPEEAERKMRYYWSKATPYTYGLVLEEDGKPLVVFVLRRADDVVRDEDGGVTWKVREISLGLHSFIELTTGEKRKRTVYLPICLVNPHTRKAFETLVLSTVDPRDGRLNSKHAECYIARPDGKAFKIQLELPGLTMMYLMLKVMPPDFAVHMKSTECAFCKAMDYEEVKVC